MQDMFGADLIALLCLHRSFNEMKQNKYAAVALGPNTIESQDDPEKHHPSLIDGVAEVAAPSRPTQRITSINSMQGFQFIGAASPHPRKYSHVQSHNHTSK